jgi:hypothetical protein
VVILNVDVKRNVFGRQLLVEELMGLIQYLSKPRPGIKRASETYRAEDPFCTESTQVLKLYDISAWHTHCRHAYRCENQLGEPGRVEHVDRASCTDGGLEQLRRVGNLALGKEERSVFLPGPTFYDGDILDDIRIIKSPCSGVPARGRRRYAVRASSTACAASVTGQLF